MFKKLLFIASFLFCCLPAHAAWTLTQVKDNTTCTSGTTCAVTVTSTGAGHLLVAAVQNFATISISGVTAGACATTWTHVTNGQLFVSTIGSVDMYYCLNSNSGQTSITITASTFGTNGVGIIWEASSSLGTIAVDSGATPSGNKNNTVNCTACAGVALTLSGNNDFIAAAAGCGGTCSAVTGTGFTNDLANPNGNGISHGITTGNLTAPATWTQSPTGKMVSNAAAFQETSASTPIFSLSQNQMPDFSWGVVSYSLLIGLLIGAGHGVREYTHVIDPVCSVGSVAGYHVAQSQSLLVSVPIELRQACDGAYEMATVAKHGDQS